MTHTTAQLVSTPVLPTPLHGQLKQERKKNKKRKTLRCFLVITKTCPCNVYPLEPHFYIEKMRYAGVDLFFLFFLQNIDCGYSLELPQ